ncbi:MAG: hypothetical protein EGR45_00180 [Ruminococcaceae bacterium]|nr:hypothetical protein [Oscillospiraceae bacterium]
MKHRLFKCGRLSGMLLGAAALLALVPLMSVPALAEEPGAAYAASSTPAVSNSDGMDFTPTAKSWGYYNEKGDKKYFSPTNDVDWNITARDWKWYGKGEGDIQPYTLEIMNNFNLYTTDNYAIKLPAGSTVIFHADVLLESKVNCIYSEGSITLKGVSENNDRHTLTFGSAGISSGLDVTVENLNLKTDPESVESYEYAIEANKNLRLQECYFYAGDEWKGKNVVNCDTYNISRDVYIDIPGSYFTSRSGYGNYIADIAYVSNVIFDDSNEIRIGEYYKNITNTLSPADDSARMELITNTFWTADYGKYIYEEALSDTESGNYKTLGGKTYSIELSDLMSTNINEYEWVLVDADSLNSKGYKIGLYYGLDDLWYLNVTVPNENVDRNTDVYIDFSDTEYAFGTGETKRLHLIIGESLKTNKLEIVNPSKNDADDLLKHVDISLKVNNKEIPYIKDSKLYYLIPEYNEFKLSLLPKNCELTSVFYGDSDTDCEPIGPSIDALYTNIPESDKGVYIWYSESDEKQYSTLSISDELISAVKAGKINSVIAYDDVSDKAWSLDSAINEFPTSFLNGKSIEITISAEDYGVSEICGKNPRYSSEKEMNFYKLDYLFVEGDTVITAPVRELCKFNAFSVNGPQPTIKGDRDPSGMGYLGVEYTITVPYSEGKLLVGADFNGTSIEPYTADDNGWNYKITTISGAENKFVFTYTDVATLRIPKPEHGKVEFTGNLDGGRGVDTLADGTSVYTLATNDTVTLKFVPDDGYKFVSAAQDGSELKVGSDGTCVLTMEQLADWTITAKFEKKSGGSTGGSSGGSHRHSTDSDKTAESTPTMDGKPMSWNDIGNYLSKLPENSSAKISLNGKTTLPAAVISAIKDGKLTVEFVIDSAKSWVVCGDKIGTVSAAELAAFPGNADSSALRGVFGVDLKVSGTKVPAEMKLTFRKEFAGQFANVYKLNSGVLEFQRCVKVGADGTAVIPGADAAGEYVVMVCEFSDLPGDADNDGVLSALDASAILKEIVDKAKSANAAVCDFNGDGEVNALDAAAALKAVVEVR